MRGGGLAIQLGDPAPCGGGPERRVRWRQRQPQRNSIPHGCALPRDPPEPLHPPPGTLRRGLSRLSLYPIQPIHYPTILSSSAPSAQHLSPNNLPQSAQRPQRPTLFQEIRETRRSRNVHPPFSDFHFQGLEIPGVTLRTNGEAVGTQPTRLTSRVGWVPGVLCGSNAISGFMDASPPDRYRRGAARERSLPG